MLDAVQKPAAEPLQRMRVRVRGAVQGVGFRPFVYRLADELGLTGWVNNSPQGVVIEVEGPAIALGKFLLRLSSEKPPRAFIQSLEHSYLDAAGYAVFEIRKSESTGAKTALVQPDVATCDECLADILDTANRRYRYPFTNCTNCGPRFSIIRALPYDRANTTMAGFVMCGECRAEYEDPLDRRFHAQPNACPACGPHIELWDAAGNAVTCDDALTAAADAIRNGSVVAIKGLGGFHLVVDARNDEAVRELRRRKHREEKPLALMVPSFEAAEQFCEISDLEKRLITSPEAPIVLLRSRADNEISKLVAPHNPFLGVMLPYTPLHHLLMRELGLPIVATSGNRSDEPICIDENEALTRLAGIADLVLVHDRPIERHVDDSIVRVMMRREMVVRRARGFAPLPVEIGGDTEPVIAAGAHLKNTVAVGIGDRAYVSQHIGDLETKEAYGAFGRVIDDVEHLYEIAPGTAACDLHPDYVSTKWAAESGLRRIPVQHHYAHILSCMAENHVAPPALGFAWDGTGLGTDGTIWGGEFLTINDDGFERFAHLRTFRLAGGDKAIREPRRSALGVLYEVLGDRVFERRDLFPIVSFTDAELRVIKPMLKEGINSPVTSSAGRLFDAVASILGVRERVAFEGQAAMELEFLADPSERDLYEIKLGDESPIVIDWEPMLRDIVSDIDVGVRPAKIAAKFHNTLVEMMAAVTKRAGFDRVVLSGGCFQNKYLLEHAVERLTNDGSRVYWHQRVPTNDGGISLGQVAAAAVQFKKQRRKTAVCV